MKGSRMQAEALRMRLAAVESLCRYPQAGVRLKMRDSAKLARADDDLAAAIEALSDMRVRLGPDQRADALAIVGQSNAESYLRSAGRSA